MIGADIISIWEWIGTFILLAIPIVNLVMIVIWIFSGSTNPSKRNFILAQLIFFAVIFTLIVIVSIVAPSLLTEL